MTRYSTLIASGAALALAALSAVPAYAIPTYTAGSFAFHIDTTNTDDLATLTTLTVSPATMQIGSLGGDMASVSVPDLAIPSTFDLTAFSNYDWSDGGVGSFTASSILYDDVTGSCSSSCTRSIGISGTFLLGTDWANAGSIDALETWSLTQTGTASVISGSGTFSAPPPTPTPEPATLALFGVGLAGLGMVRRRKAK